MSATLSIPRAKRLPFAEWRSWVRLTLTIKGHSVPARKLGKMYADGLSWDRAAWELMHHNGGK